MIENIYTFVGDDGENIHIDAAGLRLWCIAAKPEIFWLPMDRSLALQFLRENTISIERADELAKRGQTDDPIIMVKDGTYHPVNGGPNVLLVDGHHRYFNRVRDGYSEILGHLLEVEQWKPFQVHGIPAMTKDQLRSIPVPKRNY